MCDDTECISMLHLGIWMPFCASLTCPRLLTQSKPGGIYYVGNNGGNLKDGTELKSENKNQLNVAYKGTLTDSLKVWEDSCYVLFEC